MTNTIKDALKTFSQDGVKQYLEVEKSISRHRELDVDEDEIKLAQNIINFYLESKKNEDVNELSSILGPSDLWANIIKKHHKKIIDHCNNNNASGLALTLKNIYQSKSTLGMTYPDAQKIHDSKIHRNVYAKLRVARALKEYRKKINDRLSDELANKLISILENNYGNPLLVKMFNKYVSFEALYHLLILLDLNEMLPLNKLHNKSIMDLGSGLGVVQALMMGLLEDIECTYIDLPENLIYVAWFVSKYCPNVHINFGEMNNNVSKPVINLIPYFYIDRIPLNRADLLIHLASLKCIRTQPKNIWNLCTQY